MHILVVNDDGPPSLQSSPYVLSLVGALQSADHAVSVVLPHTQRSWISKAHIVGQPIRPTYYRPASSSSDDPTGLRHVDEGKTSQSPLQKGAGGEEWILIDSTPASCVQIGLFHYFKEKGPVDLVLSGPNYGRNTTAVFALSSGTIGGALEGAVCGKKSIALSYAFFDRNHTAEVIEGASRLSVKIIEKLVQGWGEGVQLYSVNVPLVADVGSAKIVYTKMLQNEWSSGSCFEAIEVPEEEDWGPEEGEERIRRAESGGQESLEKREKLAEESSGGEGVQERYKHMHFKWTPKFKDVYESVDRSGPGSDGWAVKEGQVSITPLRANFMHVDGFEGEFKL
ncbi:sure-like protein [Aulographum hederae CBS 113979]|uniref:Sure-like protein n=1 Tax=Aulographum hederae CBS 113979 TaxID=1176131 RepID=A0A6G1H1F5_9PEZI|nr:sure-like protein [Aulographum hederae CBS 113979]